MSKGLTNKDEVIFPCVHGFRGNALSNCDGLSIGVVRDTQIRRSCRECVEAQ